MERAELEKQILVAMHDAAKYGFAQVRNGKTRRVIIWPIASRALGLWKLQLIDADFELSRTIGGGYVDPLKHREVIRTILVFFFGKLIEDDDRIFDEWINQGERRCFVLGETVTPTRLKICYDLPASGPTVAWRHHVSFVKPRSEVTVDHRTGIRHSGGLVDVRYLTKL